MRAVVTCECCGHRQAVERSIEEPESFFVICHGCEGVLRVQVTADAIRTAEAVAASRITDDRLGVVQPSHGSERPASDW